MKEQHLATSYSEYIISWPKHLAKINFLLVYLPNGFATITTLSR
jgi:hypothetical protein